MGLLDRFIGNLTRGQSQGPYALNEDDRKALGRQGLLQAGLQMLATPSNGSQGIARGLLAGVQGIQGGADALVNDRYRTDVMERTRAQMEANTAREQAMRGVLNPDGTLNQERFGAFAQIDPLEALRLRQQINEANAPQTQRFNPIREVERDGMIVTEEMDPVTGEVRVVGMSPKWQRGVGGGGSASTVAAAPSAAGGGVGGGGGMGRPPSGYRWTADGGLEPIPGGPADKGGTTASAADPSNPTATFNDRQKGGVAALHLNLLNYAAAITGKPRSELELMTAQEIANAVRNADERVVEGGFARVLSAIPFGQTAVDVANPDLASFAKGAASGLAAIQNPIGIITTPDVELSYAQSPNPTDPRDVQATKIENFLTHYGYQPRARQTPAPAAAPAAPTGIPAPGEIRNGYRFKGGNPADRNSWEKV